MKHARLLFVCILGVCIGFATQARAQQSAPTNVQAAPGNGMAAVVFQAPAAESGSTITGYTVVSNPSGGHDNSAGTSAVFHIVTGLNNDTAYTFTVEATNSLGHTSGASGASNSVTPSLYAYAPYAGTWDVSDLLTGVGAPYAAKCVETVNADGSIGDFNCSDASGSQTAYTNCSAWLFPFGMTVTCDQPIADDFVCFANTAGSANSVQTCTGSLNNGSTTLLAVGVKQGSLYSNSDIDSSSWYGEGLQINTGSARWEQDVNPPISVDGNGNITASVTTSNNPTVSKTISGTLALASDGLLTFTCTSASCNGGTGSWYLNAGKTVASGFTDYASDDVELHLLSKPASSYSLADLAGYWVGNEANSNGTWRRVIIEVNGDGSYVVWQYDNNDNTSSGTGNFTISDTGVVSNVGVSGSDLSAVMDASKTVLTATETQDASSANPFYGISVVTKAASLWPNAVAFTGNWMGVDWLGNFNVNGAPWIYHQTLGWLYPLLSGASTDSIWFYDPQWDGTGGWWWTSSSFFPWIYSNSEGWLYFDAKDSTPSMRWFFNGAGKATVH